MYWVQDNTRGKYLHVMTEQGVTSLQQCQYYILESE